MERDLLIILVFILISILVIVVVYHSLSIFKTQSIQGSKGILPQYKTQERKINSEAEYRRVIEKSKSEYKAFMEQRKHQSKDSP